MTPISAPPVADTLPDAMQRTWADREQSEYRIVVDASNSEPLIERLRELWGAAEDSVSRGAKQGALSLAIDVGSALAAGLSAPHIFLLRDGRHSFEWQPDGERSIYASLVLDPAGEQVEQYVGDVGVSLAPGVRPRPPILDTERLLQDGIRTFLLTLREQLER